ncbi:MAG: hypothetical protein ACR2QC_04085 [Gammaproteobacteria bacterium]
MKEGYSWQYKTPCLLLEEEDMPSSQEIINQCRDIGAIFYEDGPGDECFVVDVARGVGPELWTPRALRGYDR